MSIIIANIVMAIRSRHIFHLVDRSPWPILSALFAIRLTIRGVYWFNGGDSLCMIMAMAGLILVRGQWWRDVSREATYLGDHSKVVELGIRWVIVLFIISEVFFFVSFFWAFFYSRLIPVTTLGINWPPIGVYAFNPLGVPLLNSLVLLSSGVSVTWAHHSLLSRDGRATINGLTLTVLLGVYFTCLQALEYWEARFRFRDRVYGRVFFIATGFHGLHVLVGTKFLLVRAQRIVIGHFSHRHHTGFEIAAWYWHFVDVVWLFLYIWVYIWGRA
jgi:cytochrome c oxidase subunit 3